MRRTFIGRLLAGIRDGWLVLGISLALFLALEWAYRGQAELRRAIRGDDTEPSVRVHPYAGLEWWEAWREARASVQSEWDPWRGWHTKPLAAPGLNVDSLGLRRTVQPSDARPPRVHLAMFGGSTMWGYTARDAHTIPSLLARELRARGLAGVDVTNHAQSAYTLAQNVASLTQLVREGKRPHIAVFLDGNNELAVAWRTGEVGSILAAPYLAERMDHRHDIVSDLLRWGGSSELVQRVGRAAGLRPPEAVAPPAAETACPEVADQYARQVRQVVAMGDGLGFQPVFLWQPLLANSEKPRTDWEGEVGAAEGWVEGLRACRRATTEAMASVPAADFHDLSDLFDAHSGTVFIDAYGHVTEAANAVIAERIADLVEEEVRALLGR